MQIILFVVVLVAGPPPTSTQNAFPMESVSQCLEAAEMLLSDEAIRAPIEQGGFLQTSCVIQFPPGSAG